MWEPSRILYGGEWYEWQIQTIFIAGEKLSLKCKKKVKTSSKIFREASKFMPFSEYFQFLLLFPIRLHTSFSYHGEIHFCSLPKSIDSCLVLDRVELPVVSDVLVLTHAVVPLLGLFPDDDAVLLPAGEVFCTEVSFCHISFLTCSAAWPNCELARLNLCSWMILAKEGSPWNTWGAANVTAGRRTKNASAYKTRN